jgi:hypothetical protein
MSAVKERVSWVERWWPLLLILFGVLCFLGIDFFHPGY